MEKEYYTPKPEEFHLGFEFESKIGNGLIHPSFYEEGKEWKQTVVQHGDFFTTINPKSVRVKYLDQEDLEELGWYMDLDTHQRYEYEDYIMHGFVADGMWAIKKKRLYEKHGDLFSAYDTLFEGKIKNKSELKRLMVQLGITKEQ